MVTDYSKSPNLHEFLKSRKVAPARTGTETGTHCLHRSFFGGRVERQEGDLRPAVCDEHLTIAFIEEEGIAIEIMEIK